MSGDHDVDIGIILHDLKDLNLMTPEAPAIAIDEVSEEVDQLTLIITIFSFFFNVLADIFDELKHVNFIVEHRLVIVVHLLQEINAAHVALNVMDHLRNVPLHLGLDLVEVLYQRNDEEI